MTEESGSWGIEVLNQLNHEKWFRLMKAKLEGKGVKYILEKTLHEYARAAHPDPDVAAKDNTLEEVTGRIEAINLNSTHFLKVTNPQRSESATPATESTTPITPDASPRIFLNIEKKEKYLKDTGTVKFYLLRGLDDNDQALLDEYETPKELWVYLQTKYDKPSKIAAAKYTRDLNNFTWSENLTITDAWNKLKELRRKISSSKPSAKGQYDDEALMLILTTALPQPYQSTIDSLNINTSLSVDD